MIRVGLSSALRELARLRYAVRVACLACLAWVLLVLPAHAQSTFSLDVVLVTEFHPAEPGLEPVASALHKSIEARLGAEFLVAPFASVPPYPEYSAGVYLDSCPEGQYTGCSYILGVRANANWVVTAEIAPGLGGDPEVLFSIIDVAAARPVVQFSSLVTPENHRAVGDGVALILHTVVAGAGQTEDIRGETEDSRLEWERRREEARRTAEELAFADQDLQILVRPEAGDFDDRLTTEDLERFEGRDDVPPWEKAGMGKAEYVRFKNSGESLDAWKKATRGRQGQLLVTLSAGFGSGPYRHRFDGRWVIDDQTLEPIATASLQQMEMGPINVFSLEVAFGILPTVDVGLAIGTRSVRFNWYYQRELENEDIIEKISEDGTFRYTTEYRLRGTWAPFPTLPIRPTAYAALAWWKGSSIDRVVRVDGPVEAFADPSYLMLHAGPGVEVSPNDRILLFARITTELILVGSRTESRVDHAEAFQDPAVPRDLGLGAGAQITFGVTGRVGPFLKR